eukprot:TCONS_00010169-protein
MVEFVWQHYNISLGKYTTVPVSRGGGARKKSFKRLTAMKEIFTIIKETYFPGGESKHKGSLHLLKAMLHASDHTLMNLSSTLDDFLKLKKMKHNKLILKTSKDWDPTKEMQSKE